MLVRTKYRGVAYVFYKAAGSGHRHCNYWRKSWWDYKFAMMRSSTKALPAGGIIYPIVFERLQHLGFRWATRIIAFIMLITLFVPITLMRMRIKQSIARRLFDFNAWTEPAFITFACAGFCGSIGLYIPYFYVQTYSLEHGIVARGSLFVYLVSLINAGSVFGRIVSQTASQVLLRLCSPKGSWIYSSSLMRPTNLDQSIYSYWLP